MARSAKVKTEAAAEAALPPIVSYKGFDKNLQCRGFQFEIGKTYKAAGKIAACFNGFHACENPFDVWSYYGLGDDNRFAVVEQSGTTARHAEDSKIASAEITIKAELTLPDFIKRGIDWLLAACKVEAGEDVQTASGDSSQLAASGDSSQLAASGDSSKLAASGHSSQLAASGHSSKLAASGHSSKLAASGDSSQLAASGDSSQLAASGHSSKLAASGHYSQLAASGDSSKLAASGHYSQLAASGHYSQLAASGHYSVIAASSYAAQARGVTGTWISLAEFNAEGRCIGFATGCIGQDELEADTWYRASGGKLVKVTHG